MVSRLGFLCCGVGVGVCGVRVCLVPPPCLELCLFGVFLWLFLCFGGVLWFVLGWCGYCFAAVWLLFCLRGVCLGLGCLFMFWFRCWVVFPCVFGWCSWLFWGTSDGSSNLPRATIVVRMVRESDFTDVVAEG